MDVDMCLHQLTICSSHRSLISPISFISSLSLSFPSDARSLYLEWIFLLRHTWSQSQDLLHNGRQDYFPLFWVNVDRHGILNHIHCILTSLRTFNCGRKLDKCSKRNQYCSVFTLLLSSDMDNIKVTVRAFSYMCCPLMPLGTHVKCSYSTAAAWASRIHSSMRVIPAEVPQRVSEVSHK